MGQALPVFWADLGGLRVERGCFWEFSSGKREEEKKRVRWCFCPARFRKKKKTKNENPYRPRPRPPRPPSACIPARA